MCGKLARVEGRVQPGDPASTEDPKAFGRGCPQHGVWLVQDASPNLAFLAWYC